ncbi:MAG: hypothetical protein F6K04_19240 [Leptolyngbya sp. SIO4C5]|nr:hypothetical protein [Leptolyngbya sp. SIO4C5]
MLEPDYPHIVFAFDYRGFRIAIDESDFDGQPLYAAWVDYAWGSAVAVRGVFSRREAIYKARRWVDRRIETSPLFQS